MPQIPILFLLFLTQIPLQSALPVLPHSDPAPVQPSLLFPSSSVPTTIPAFPEQSDIVGSCPLDLPDDLLHGVSAACSASNGRRPSRLHCCPALAAWLYSAYSATALAVRSLPAAQTYDLPVLPDDSESCVDSVEKSLRARGVELPRVNGTCDVAYCYCGIRLRQLSCAGPFVASSGEGRWGAREDEASRMERDCSRSGLAGCSRCLRTLNQLKNAREEGRNATGSGSKARDKECQLMGLTWLLAKNRTLYLPTATAVLRAFMLAPFAGDGGAVDPISCSLPHDEMPFAVASSEIDGDGYSSAAACSLSPSSISFAILILLILSSLFY